MNLKAHHKAYIKAAAAGYHQNLVMHNVPTDTANQATAAYAQRLTKRAANRQQALANIKLAGWSAFVKSKIAPHLKSA